MIIYGPKPLKDGDDECGTITIYVAEKDKSGAIQPPNVDEGAHVFEFIPKKKEVEKDKDKGEKKEGSDDCCGGNGYGWIQHVFSGGRWTYDNGAFKPPGGPGKPSGADSDPDKASQPTDRPAGQDGTGKDRWKENPWYGASTDPKVDKDDFATNPQPQEKIGDLPGGDKYITQLACVKGGKVQFVWEWSSTENGKKKANPTKK